MCETNVFFGTPLRPPADKGEHADDTTALTGEGARENYSPTLFLRRDFPGFKHVTEWRKSIPNMNRLAVYQGLQFRPMLAC